jgi:hypothetical protein
MGDPSAQYGIVLVYPVVLETYDFRQPYASVSASLTACVWRKLGVEGLIVREWMRMLYPSPFLQ